MPLILLLLTLRSKQKNWKLKNLLHLDRDSISIEKQLNFAIDKFVASEKTDKVK